MLLPIRSPQLPTIMWHRMHRPHLCRCAASTTPPADSLPHYAAYPLDRAAALRPNTERLEQLLSNPTTQLHLYQTGNPLLQPANTPGTDPQGTPAAWQPVAICPASRALAHAVGGTQVFLGMDGHDAVFAAEIADDADVKGVCSALGLHERTIVGNLRKHGPHMAPPDAALAATAGGLLQWHRRTTHDPASGGRLSPTQGGHARISSSGGGRAVYPRIDPAVIVLVTCGDWALLGRKAAWEAGRYSCLAGFCEIGETLEQAVSREVEEEAGVVVDHARVQYHSSQPWPFPSSLMVGFVATVDDQHAAGRTGYQWLGQQGVEAAQSVGVTEAEVHAAHSGTCLPAVQVDEEELQDARWFHRDALHDVVYGHSSAAGFRIPQRYALAHRIVDSWLRSTKRPLDAVASVRIDEGVFKYVLARVSDPASGASKLVIRGDVRAGYHDHVLGHLRNEAQLHGLEVDVCGGGRMEHHSKPRVVQVYGYSSAFGAAPHEVTAALLHRALPLYSKECITVSYDGY